MYFCRFLIPYWLHVYWQTIRFARTFLRRYAPAAAGPLGLLLLLAGCATPPKVAPLTEPAAVTQQIAAEPVGDFFVGRRVYAPPFALWGYVRSPRQSWRTAQLLFLNKKYQFPPNRPLQQLSLHNRNHIRPY